MNPYELARLEAKTGQQRFSQILQHDFKLAPKIAQVIVQEAEQYLSTSQAPLKVGQIRVILAQRHTKTAQAVTEMETVEVTWTLDAGGEDLEVLHQHGPQKLRQVRLQRLLAEALVISAQASSPGPQARAFLERARDTMAPQVANVKERRYRKAWVLVLRGLGRTQEADALAAELRASGFRPFAP